jgi:hypothetical protein
MKKYYVALFILFASSTNAFSDFLWTRYGGDISCGKLTTFKDSNQLIFHAKGWSFGYISAMNELLKFSLQEPIDEYGVWLAIMKHCEQHPMDDQYAAIVSVWLPVIMGNDPTALKRFLELHKGR